ncbi:MAG: YggT family protein [Gammaproteobacteria bacterium]|nr:YggT family protein [Gammaproteobacteria bacterium]
MQSALIFVLQTLLDLYIVTFFLRVVLAWTRADFRNPLAQFIIKVTNPLVIPARRLIPSIGGLDTATLVVMFLLQVAATALLASVGCGAVAEPAQLVLTAGLRLVHLVLSTYTYLILIYVVASWVSPGGYNPAIAMLSGVVEPVIAPFRRVIPAIGGMDLSPLFAILLVQALKIAIPAARLCTAF